MFRRIFYSIGLMAFSVTSIVAAERCWKPIDTHQVESAVAYSDSKGNALRKDCGPIAAFCVLNWFNMTQSIDRVFAHFPDASEKGVSLGDLSQYFKSFDFYTNVSTVSVDSLIEKPGWIGILYFPGKGQEMGHFVASRVIERKLQILDGTRSQFFQGASGTDTFLTLEVSRSPIFIPWLKRIAGSSIGLYLGSSCLAVMLCLNYFRKKKFSFSAPSFALVIFFCLLFSQCSPKRKSGGVQITVDNPHHDAGIVTLSSERMSIRHIFHVFNSSSTPLKIADYASSCTCGKLKVFANAIRPGEVGDIEATMDLSIYRTGNIPVEFLVKFDPPDISPLRLSMFALVTSNTLVTPTIVEFGELASGESIEVPITIWTAERSLRHGKIPSSMIRAELEGQSDLINVALTDSRLDAAQVPEYQRFPIRCILLIKTGFAKGEVKSNLLIHWMGEKGMEFAIPIFGRVVSDVDISPSVSLALPTEDGALSAISFINAHGDLRLDSPPEIVDSHSDLKVFKLTPTTDKQWKVEWRLRPRDLVLAKSFRYSYTIRIGNYSTKGEVVLP